MLIDAHVHVWERHPDFSPPGATIVGPHTAVPVELLDEYLDQHDVARAVLVQPIYPGDDNSYVADCAAARPQRFAAVCVVDPHRADAPDRLAYWIRERGCRGLRLRPRIAAESAVFGDASTFPLWEQAAELGVVISVLANSEHLATLKALALQFPTVSIVVDHLAHPDTTVHPASRAIAGLLDLADCPNVSIKVSGYYYYSHEPYPYADCHEMFRTVLARFGAARLIWGSDFPHVVLKTTYARASAVPDVALPGLTAADRAQIMGHNAHRLYWR